MLHAEGLKFNSRGRPPMSEPGAVATGSRETFQNDLTELLSWTPITERKSGQQLCHRREEAKYLRALPSNVYEKAPKARDATAWANGPRSGAKQEVER